MIEKTFPREKPLFLCRVYTAGDLHKKCSSKQTYAVAKISFYILKCWLYGNKGMVFSSKYSIDCLVEKIQAGSAVIKIL